MPFARGKDSIVQHDVILFHQFPKTAGGSIAVTFRDHPDSALMTWLEYTLPDAAEVLACSPAKIIFVAGHTVYGIHRHLRQAPRYITIFRDPLERLISEFFFTTQHPGTQYHLKNHVDRVREVRKLALSRTNLNYYCFILSKYYFDLIPDMLPLFCDPVETIREGQRRRLFIVQALDLEKVDASLTYELAAKNLENDFVYVGDFSNLAATMRYLQDRSDINLQLTARIHQTERPMVQQIFSRDEIDEIQQKMKYDYMLVESVKQFHKTDN